MASLRRKAGFQIRRAYSSLVREKSFAVAFDIDGVLLRANKPLAGASQALSRLYSQGKLHVPFMLFTNGGGFTEAKKSLELSRLLNVNISTEQVFLSHTSFKALASCYENKRSLAVGKGEPACVLSEYGFGDVISMDDFVCYFKSIDPLEQYKPWMKAGCSKSAARSQKNMEGGEKDVEGGERDVEAVFVVSDPVDWGRDIQVISDILNGGGNPLRVGGKAPPLYFAADDLIYQGAFPVVRYGMGAFRIALESVYTRLTGGPMSYHSYGKPKREAFKLVQNELEKLARSLHASSPLQTIYMIGDNPATDIRGAKEAGKPWYSILVRTGCFRGVGNDAEFPADEVVENVEEAVSLVLKREGLE